MKNAMILASVRQLYVISELTLKIHCKNVKNITFNWKYNMNKSINTLFIIIQNDNLIFNIR